MTFPRIVLPEAGRDHVVVASVSGGKDSTALILALREAGIQARHVFADTGWEAPETYAYLDTLRSYLGIAIDVVAALHPSQGRSDALISTQLVRRGAMEEYVLARHGFPIRKQRWCTRELKLEPLRAYHDLIEKQGSETVSVIGVRAEESESRAAMVEWEDEASGERGWGGYVWRPLLPWTIADVLAIHHRHGVPVNPLYLRGHNRVGCYPCIFSQKEEVRLIAKHDPERVARIEALEREVSESRALANVETPGRFKHTAATFFQGMDRTKGATPPGIREVVEWSKTTRGAPVSAPSTSADWRVHALGTVRAADARCTTGREG